MKYKSGYNYSSEYYDNLSYRNNMNYKSKGEKIRISKIITLAGENNKILDVGCFDGTLGKLLIDRNNVVYGIDASKRAINIAREKGLIAKCGNIEKKFEFKDNFFDGCIIAEVIEHILDTDSFIDNLKKVLKPNGFIVLSTPNVASIGRRLLLFFGKNPFFEASFGYPPNASAGHLRFFTKELLVSFLEHKGFKVIKFVSDVVNLTASGNISSSILANYFPKLGRCLIIKAKLINKE